MRKLILAAFLALLAPALASAQVCMTVNDVRACLSQFDKIECETGIPGVTFINQVVKDKEVAVGVILAGSPVCVLRIEPGTPDQDNPKVVVKARMVTATSNGSTMIEERDVTYFASQVSAANNSTTLTLGK
jgi:hypothetical protein